MARYFKSVDLFGNVIIVLLWFKIVLNILPLAVFVCGRQRECICSRSHRWWVCWVGVCWSGCVCVVGAYSVPKKEHTNTFTKTHPVAPHLSPSITVMWPIPLHLTVGIIKIQPISCHLCICPMGSLLHTFKVNWHQGLTLFHKHTMFIWPYQNGFIALKVTV